nr:PREDICTED: myrosinase 1-like isoform X1 [Bemisia tabaci]
MIRFLRLERRGAGAMPSGSSIFFIVPTLLLTLYLSGRNANHASKGDMADDWRTFPKDFIIGVGSASYQIEGGTKDDGRGESTFDRFVKTSKDTPVNGITYENADVSSDNYHHLEEDVKLLKELGVDFYRFSISWSRILPTGDIRNINQAGIDHYNRLIDLLLEKDIKPFVTMFHWDYPQPLQDLGGWTNPVMVDYFVEFAHLLLKTYGDRVKLWLTHNEPRLFSVGAYAKVSLNYPQLAPGIIMPGIAEYLSVHHILLSHAKVYHMYDKQFRPHQHGKMGISLDTFFYRPQTPAEEEARDRLLQFHIGWIANPIFGTGDYPEVVRRIVDENSKKEGRLNSRLPRFSDQEIRDLKGSADFFGINHYTTYLARDDPNVVSVPSIDRDAGVNLEFDPKSKVAGPFWLIYEPEGFRELLNWLKKEYNNPPIFITENGCSQTGKTLTEELNDDRRIGYIQAYLEQLLKAVNIDKVNVTGYSGWSFMDSFEWDSGFNERFGFYHVDFKDPKRTRRAKKSASFYREILLSRFLQPQIQNGTHL